MKRQLLISFFVLLFLGLGTLVAIFYGKGYTLDFTPGKGLIKGTGLLVATSTPDGASVFIDGHLTTATNNTINLPPGQYNVTITKDDYFPWKKTLTIDKEVVTKAQATLFPTTPQLEAVTTTGALSPIIDPSYTKIAYVVASQSAKKNGVYVLDMGSRSLLTFAASATQIADDTVVNFDNAVLSWSPDSKNLLATITNPDTQKTTTYELDATTFNVSPQDVTETLSQVTAPWDKIVQDKQTAGLNTLKPALKNFALANMTNMVWSPDETKFLYTASESGLLSQIIVPKIIGTNSTPEDRNLVKGNMYVYDTKEDKNYLILKAEDVPNQKVMWFPDSSHLIVTHDRKVDIREYDGINNTTVYAGPFTDHYVFPWPTGEDVVVLTNLGNSNTPANLYTISLK